ncbi:MAG: diacylglycerol kinase family lipid kinase [Chloroflexi bacterium]|nr:diacylglycerol kinase family lipid kinase [Chloroflexota bacterium]
MPSTIVIFNPFANRGDSQHQIDLGLQSLATSGLDFEVRLTEYPGHGIELALTAVRDGATTIIAAGGDGTVHEVANGILKAAEGMEGVAPTTLGVLPVGSGNDFAWGLGIDQGLDDAIARIRLGHTRIIDVAQVETDVSEPRYCVNMLGGGFDARVNVEAHKIKRLRGFAIYIVAVLKTLAIYYRHPPTTIRYDDQEKTFSMLMGLVANGLRVGGGFLATPNALYDDGLLDLCLVEKTTRWDMLRMIPQFMKGQHLDHPKVTMARSHKVHFSCQQGFPAQLDGEMVGLSVKDMQIEIIPQRLRVIV